MATTTYGDISPRTAGYAVAKMLRHAAPVIVLQKFGATKPHPKNKTKTVKFRRAVPFDAATVPLVEGVTPSAQRMSYEDVETTLQQYGGLIEITDVIEDTHEDPVLSDAVELTGEQAAATLEKLTYGTVKAGTNVLYANGANRAAVNTPVTLALIRKAIRALKAQKAKKITRILDSSANYGTSPIEAAYVAVCHTHLEADIRGLAGFIPTAEYGSRRLIAETEFGAVEDVRFVTSPDLDPWVDAGGAYAGSGTDMVSTSGTSADVYPILLLGQDAFACVPLKGAQSISPTVLSPGKASKSDPLGQRGYVGWKTYFATIILNQLWMLRIEVAATEL